MAHSNETQEDLMRPFLNKFLQYLLCNLGYKRPNLRDSERERIFIVELNLSSLALSQRTSCLRKFRYQMNESSIVQFYCNQIPHVLTF